MEQVGILLVDDDVASQQALKSVLDSEGWRVRIVPKASEALGELATGGWDLAIVNVALADPRGPLFAILRELAQAQIDTPKREAANPDGANPDDANPAENGPDTSPKKGIRVLFLVPLLMATDVQPILEREELPHSPKPYHLHEFLERVSELLVESGAIAEPIRGVGGFTERKTRRRQRFGRGTRANSMFAPRDDYQMTEEEMNEWERQEEEQRKKAPEGSSPRLRILTVSAPPPSKIFRRNPARKFPPRRSQHSAARCASIGQPRGRGTMPSKTKRAVAIAFAAILDSRRSRDF